jgi:hypothetical protein
VNSRPSPIGVRDHRLDVFRGLALMMIFINHVPGNVYEALTSRNYGFSDAAEAFVLMSGIAVGLAYSRGFQQGRFVDALLKVWRRAGKIYVTHIVITAWAIAIIAAGIVYFDTTEVVQRVNFTRVLDRPLASMIGVPLLTHQLGYFNILPLYLVLLLVSPIYVMIGLRSRLSLVLVAAAIWFIAGSFRLNFPNYPNPGGWFFNPFSWQLIYAIGIAAGLDAKEGRKLVPYDKSLFMIACGYLALSLVWVQFRLGAFPGSGQLPFFIAGYDKTFVALPRLLHVLALTYVLTNLDAVSKLLATRPFKPIELMGQHGLTVFAAGSVICIALQVIRARYQTTVLEDGALLMTGILIQYGLAVFLALIAPKQTRPAASSEKAKVQEGVSRPALATLGK